jgi:hypothetical protein
MDLAARIPSRERQSHKPDMVEIKLLCHKGPVLAQSTRQCVKTMPSSSNGS